jgi:serine/threonine protein kinase
LVTCPEVHIFAFGCILFEMMSNRPAFEGESATEILGRVVTAEPEWSRLPAETPLAVLRLLRRSLNKDPKQRLADIRDARLEIEEAVRELSIGIASPGRIGTHVGKPAWPAWLVA